MAIQRRSAFDLGHPPWDLDACAASSSATGARVHMIGRKNGREGGWRTPLHAATDWPGYFPAAPVAVALLLELGLTRTTTAAAIATPLHSAASTDDVGVGRRAHRWRRRPGDPVHRPPLDNADRLLLLARRPAPGRREAPRRRQALARSGARDGRADGATPRRAPDAGRRALPGVSACLRRANGARCPGYLLLARGADLDWVPDYAKGTPLDAAILSAADENLVGWLRGARRRAQRTGPILRGI